MKYADTPTLVVRRELTAIESSLAADVARLTKRVAELEAVVSRCNSEFKAIAALDRIDTKAAVADTDATIKQSNARVAELEAALMELVTAADYCTGRDIDVLTSCSWYKARAALAKVRT